jgi:ribose 5-phosphate isomerase A
MTQDELKKLVAEAALQYVKTGMWIGVGTGSTVNFFIDALAASGIPIAGAASSSNASTLRLEQKGIQVTDLNQAPELDLYIDGADETNDALELIKGGGGALTREKIVASASKQFICIADGSKRVKTLGRFPLPIEVIPLARNSIAKKLTLMGGTPVLRQGFLTDNGNEILDVHQLNITQPVELEKTLNNLPGVVCNGLFALRPADILLLGTEHGVETLTAAKP